MVRLVAGAGIASSTLGLYPADLPDLPQVNTATFLPVIRAQIEEAASRSPCTSLTMQKPPALWP